MALHIRTLLVFTGLTGIHSITTVSKVSVKTGSSISIPCLYDQQYTNNVKYLCKGSAWRRCSYAVKTNQPSSGKFSISDNKKRRIFTVTINDVTAQDADYWCAVEINNGGDHRQYFHLSVTTGTPGLYVEHQWVAGFIGGSITISCLHHNPGNMEWCRLGSSCVSSPSGSIDGTKVTIDKRVSGVSTVTMSGLRTDSSGWYWCVKGDLQMPVHLTVTEKPTTTTSATTTHLTTSATTTQPLTVATDLNKPTANGEDHRGSVDPKILIIPLSILIFIVMVALFIWFMLKKQKQTKAAATTTAEEDVTYADVVHMRQTSGQRFQAESDVNVIYSSVVSKKKKNSPKVEASADDVTYSTPTFRNSPTR